MRQLDTVHFYYHGKSRMFSLFQLNQISLKKKNPEIYVCSKNMFVTFSPHCSFLPAQSRKKIFICTLLHPTLLHIEWLFIAVDKSTETITVCGVALDCIIMRRSVIFMCLKDGGQKKDAPTHSFHDDIISTPKQIKKKKIHAVLFMPSNINTHTMSRHYSQFLYLFY